MGQHEYNPLPTVEAADGRRQPLLPLAASRRLRSSAAVPTLNAGREPAIEPKPADARMQAAPPVVETAVDENTGEPHLERPCLAIRSDMAEGLEKRVLHHFVGVGRIVQVLVGDAKRAALVNRDEFREALPRRVH